MKTGTGSASEQIILNPDGVFVRNLRKRIKGNNGNCICKQEKNRDTKCPCREFRETGVCECGLYVKIGGWGGGDE